MKITKNNKNKIEKIKNRLNKDLMYLNDLIDKEDFDPSEKFVMLANGLAYALEKFDTFLKEKQKL